MRFKFLVKAKLTKAALSQSEVQLINRICSFKVPYFIILFLIQSLGSIAQSQDTYTPQKLIAPSPTAASLGVYGSTEVSYYSGTPDISVALYDLKTLNHSLPITLRYNASGTRAWEDASWVGLGWSLNSGGVITQTIRGIDDFGNYGYYNSPSLPSIYPPLPASSINYFNEMFQNRNDGEPDIISYNLGQYSGRFLLGKKRDGSHVFMDHQNNLKLEIVGFSWCVTDPHGYKYYLGSSESMTDYNYSGNVELDNTTFANFKEDYDRIPTTARYLDSIVSPKGEVLKFIYERKGQSLSLISKSQQFFHLLNTPLTGCPDNTVAMPGIVESHNASRQVIRNLYLKQIVSSQGTIDFITSDREDIGYLGTIKPSKLSEIIVKDLKGQQIKKYKLDYGYFSQANTDGRLKLDKITEYDTQGNSKSPYLFNYFSPDNLPAKNTKSIDHWGYFNGEGNNSLVPELTVPEVKKYFKGAIRQADSVAVYPKSGVLASIVYPAGGTTSYDFELHDYSNLTGDDRFARVLKTAEAYARPGDEYSQDSKVFTITDTLNVSLSYSYMKHREDANNITNVQTEFVYLYYQNSPLGHWGTWPCPTQPDPTCGFTDGTSKFSDMVLLPGTYRIEVRYLQGYSTSASLRWYERVPLNQRKGAGLRIKSIKNNDLSGKQQVRKFTYTNDGKTTGKLINQPKYDFYGYVEINPGTDGCTMAGSYVGIGAVSIHAPGLNSNGTTVGYDKVTEVIGDGEGGRTDFFYHNIPNSAPNYPFTPQSNYALNGKLSLILAYNSNGDLIKKTEYEYDRKVEEYLPGVQLYQLPMFAMYRRYIINQYNNISSWSVMSSKNETDYDLNSNSTATTKSNYFYDNPSHKELTRQDDVLSKGGKTTVTYKYPGDVTGEIPDSLISKGQIGVILEKSQTQGNSVTKTIYDYMIDSYTGLLLPLTVKSKSNLDNVEEVRLRYHAYDNKGNILSLSKEGGAKINYVWSYNGQYPIAEINNANYSTVESLLGGKLNVESFSKKSNPTDIEIQNFLSPLRNPSNLLGSTTSAFTYKPLIGMTSSEDIKGLKTYYDYDNYNRLLNVRNHDKNIIKNYDYNYQHKQVITYSNTLVSAVFKKSCPAGQTGSDVVYAVPEGMFHSTIDVNDANRQAMAHIQANGQAYANLNGTCNFNTTTLTYNYTYASPWTISGLLVNKVTNQSYFLFGGAQSTPSLVIPLGEYRLDLTWAPTAEQGKYYIIGLNGNNQTLNTSYGSGKQSYDLSIAGPYAITLKYQ